MARHRASNHQWNYRFRSWHFPAAILVAVFGVSAAHAATTGGGFGRGTTLSLGCPTSVPVSSSGKFSLACTGQVSLPSASPSQSSSTPPTNTSTPTPTDTSSPTPSDTPISTPPAATKNCIPAPGACGWPDANSTGPDPSIQLKNSGSMTITQDGATVSGLNVTGCVTIKASNVTFRDSVIHGNGCRAVLYVPSGSSGVVITHVEIDGSKSNGSDGSPDPGLYGWGFSANYLDIHDTGDAADLETGDSLSESYLHDVRYAAGSHSDGVQVTDGSNISLLHNTIIATCRDAKGSSVCNDGVIIGADLGNINGVLVDRNLVDGGNNALNAGYGKGTGYTNKNTVFSNNRIGHNAQYGPCNFNQSITFTGNVWDDTGAPLAC